MPKNKGLEVEVTPLTIIPSITRNSDSYPDVFGLGCPKGLRAQRKNNPITG